MKHKPETNEKITRTMDPTPDKNSANNNQRFDWKSFWQWGSPCIAAIALMLVMFGYNPITAIRTTPPLTTVESHLDYVTVITDTEGNAVLTALSVINKNRMYLKWEAPVTNTEMLSQLWAISKHDGEARPITAFANTQTQHLDLNTNQWRLITNAAFLLLSEEEPDGTESNKPSEQIIGKGVSVRFSTGETPL